jgi:hypothetical protein
MTDTAARPSTGPRDPLPGPPPRAPGSVRRTTSVDQRRGGPGEPQSVVARGRDLRTDADGTTEVVDEVELRLEVDGEGTVTAVETDPPEPRLAGLVGDSESKGLRQRVDALVADHREAGTVLHQLLDDLPMASLISLYGSSREVHDFALPADRAEKMTDLCSGWRAGGTMLHTLEETGIFPIPVGPSAPPLVDPDDPSGWHDLPPMAPRSIRRCRRLDLVAGDPLPLEVHFRDSHLGADDDLEDVLHEYVVTATVEPGTLVVLSAEAAVRVLPWPECPGAVASAGRVVGEPVAGLRPKVALRFTGTTTCTHLNDVLRSMAGVTGMAQALLR